MTVSQNLIDNVNDIKTTLNEISVYNLDVKTAIELYYELAKKVNEVINELSRFEGVVSEEVVKQNEKLLYLLGEGLKEQVVIKIDELITNGTIQDLINNKIFTDLNTKIETFKQQTEEQFNTKANKNEIWSMANMGQDVKEAMTNGSVAVIGKASVLTETIVSEQVKYFSTNFLKCGKNLFNKKDIIKGIYIRHDNETIVQNSSYLCSNYIRVEKNTDYYISNCRFIAFYDSSFKYINPGVESPDKAGITFNTGNAEYIRVTLSDSANFLDSCQLEKGTTKTTYEDYYEYFPNVKVTNNNIKDLNLNLSLLSGKTLINAGDSIAYGSGNNGVGYAEIIATKYNMNFYDYSNGGATIGVTEDNNILTQIENAISNGITPDYFIFNGGTNDINTGAVVPLGELTEKYSGITYDTSTFTGGFEQICKLIRNTWPKCKILYVRVHNMASRDISLQKQYGERAKEICEKWSIPYVDLFIEGQLNTNIIIMQQFTNNSDKTHPNSEGYELYYVPLIENKLLHI